MTSVARPVAVFLFCALGTFMASCGAADDQTHLGIQGDENSAEALLANLDYMWSGNPVMIPVCWENPTAVTAARREWVRDALEGSWARHARINFTEWDTCANNDAGVHIIACLSKTAVCDIFPRSQAACGGKGCNSVNNGVELNMTGTEADTRAAAIHEFGHVLGFYHEEERTDYRPSGDRNGNGIQDNTEDRCKWQDMTGASYNPARPQFYGAYDVTSIMSYCGFARNLSTGDIAAVQKAYGRRINGSLVSPRGDCVAAHATSTTREQVFTWDCDEAYDDQEWLFGSSRLKLAPNRCLEPKVSSPVNGTSVVLDWCSSDAAETWRFENIEIRGFGGLCLDLPSGNTANGTQLQMWNCGDLNGANQRWSVSEKGTIRFGGPTSTKCVTASGNSVYLDDCSSSKAYYQEFVFKANGEIRPKSWSTAMCFDVYNVLNSDYLAGKGLPYNGDKVQLFKCLFDQLNQKWNFSGQVRHEKSNLCLGRAGASAQSGTHIQLLTCDNGPGVRWDYYFK